MKLKKVLMLGLASSVLISAGSHAASFSVEAFNQGAYLGIDPSQIEDFEDYSVGQWNESNITNVGTFEALENAGQGSGSTCTTLGGDCTELFLSDTTVNGQGNITPTDGGTNALQANDTYGMVWNASLAGGISFNEILFGIRDAADQNGTTVTISLTELNGNALDTPVTEFIHSRRPNGETLLVTLSLLQEVQSATISIISSRLNDSFTFDGGALAFVPGRFSEVPLPGAAWLFISALGGAGALRRLRGKASHSAA